jgi:hypothetical protein
MEFQVIDNSERHRCDRFDGSWWVPGPERDSVDIARKDRDWLVAEHPGTPWRIVTMKITVLEESPDATT